MTFARLCLSLLAACSTGSGGEPPVAEPQSPPPTAEGVPAAPSLFTLAPSAATRVFFVDGPSLRVSAARQEVGAWLARLGLPPVHLDASPYRRILLVGPLATAEPELMLVEHVATEGPALAVSTGREEWGGFAELSPSVFVITNAAALEALRAERLGSTAPGATAALGEALWSGEAARPSLVLSRNGGPGAPAPEQLAAGVWLAASPAVRLVATYADGRQALAAEGAVRGGAWLGGLHVSTVEVARDGSRLRADATVPASALPALLEWIERLYESP